LLHLLSVKRVQR